MGPSTPESPESQEQAPFANRTGGSILPVPSNIRPLKAPNQLIPFDDPRIPYSEGLVSSPKLDGNRGLCVHGELFTSSMKEPRNEVLKIWMAPLIQLSCEHLLAFDYELYDPEASHHAVLSGTINSLGDPLPPTLGCYIFDCAPLDLFFQRCHDLPYSEREYTYRHLLERLGDPHFIPLAQRLVTDASQALAYFDEDLANGCEGSMLRALHIDDVPTREKPVGGWYKFGRATFKDAIIWKFKVFETCDGIITSVTQRRRLRQDIPRERNEMGLMRRPTTQDAYELCNSIGAFLVRYRNDEGQIQECRVGWGRGWSLAARETLWQAYGQYPPSLIGRWIEFKHMPHGAQRGGRARLGQLVRFRPDRDGEQL